MRLAGLCFAATLAVPLAAAHAGGGVIVVDPAGGGDVDNIPEAMFCGTANDTVLVMPGLYAVEEGVPYPWPVPLDAVLNWWGTTDRTEIEESIHDCHDSVWTGVCFVFEPWCTAPGCDATPARPTSWGAIKAMYR